MTREQKIVALRWALVPVATALGFLAAGLVALLINRAAFELLWSPGEGMAGKVLLGTALPIDGAIAASLVVVSGSLMAPSCQRLVAAVLLVVGGGIAWLAIGRFESPYYSDEAPQILWSPIIGTWVGGLITFLLLCLFAGPGKRLQTPEKDE